MTGGITKGSSPPSVKCVCVGGEIKVMSLRGGGGNDFLSSFYVNHHCLSLSGCEMEAE